jgi:hypothetical protein
VFKNIEKFDFRFLSIEKSFYARLTLLMSIKSPEYDAKLDSRDLITE